VAIVRRSKIDSNSSKAEGPSSLGPVLDFLRLLWAVDHGMVSISKHMRRSMGVTGQQRLVVKLVGQCPGISAGALAEILHVHPSTLTGVLRRLVERGALVRIRDPADTRRALFRLTKRGREIDTIRSGTVEARVRGALASISQQDIAVASHVLARLARALAPKS
jgi:MarR family transcriptional regulator, organic hydroperoxide resistance regulator